MRLPRVLLTLGLMACWQDIASAQTPASAPQFQRSEMMIPMRDSVRLHTLVFTPAGGNDSVPILLTRTPYGIKESEQRLTGAYAELARDGYIFAFQDIRGRYGSEGNFLMNRPLHDPGDSAGVDEATDTYDTVEWLIHNVGRTTGRVGVLGVSYPGWLAAMAGVNAHPAVKAISPQAPMTDTRMGDDFFHYGAFRLSYGFEYASEMELTNELMVASEILRGRYRTGFNRPTAIRAGRIESYTVDLHQQSYRFLKGHRIMVQVQSTWFPVYDRNPQTFVRNIFTARPQDFRAATQRIYRSAAHPSHIALPVLEE
jgi:predicted acyl esterase